MKKNHKSILQVVVCQQVGQPRRNGQISRNINLPRLNQGETDNLHRPITSNKIELVIKKKNSQQRKVQTQMTGECCQTYKEQLIPIFLKVFQKLKGMEHSQIHFTRPPLP